MDILSIKQKISLPIQADGSATLPNDHAFLPDEYLSSFASQKSCDLSCKSCDQPGVEQVKITSEDERQHSGYLLFI